MMALTSKKIKYDHDIDKIWFASDVNNNPTRRKNSTHNEVKIDPIINVEIVSKCHVIVTTRVQVHWGSNENKTKQDKVNKTAQIPKEQHLSYLNSESILNVEKEKMAGSSSSKGYTYLKKKSNKKNTNTNIRKGSKKHRQKSCGNISDDDSSDNKESITVTSSSENELSELDVEDTHGRSISPERMRKMQNSITIPREPVHFKNKFVGRISDQTEVLDTPDLKFNKVLESSNQQMAEEFNQFFLQTKKKQMVKPKLHEKLDMPKDEISSLQWHLTSKELDNKRARKLDDSYKNNSNDANQSQEKEQSIFSSDQYDEDNNSVSDYDTGFYTNKIQILQNSTFQKPNTASDPNHVKTDENISKDLDYLLIGMELLRLTYNWFNNLTSPQEKDKIKKILFQ